MTSRSVRSSGDQAVCVQALLAWHMHIVLCSCTRLFYTLTVPLSNQGYKWVPVYEFDTGGNPALDKHPIQGE